MNTSAPPLLTLFFVNPPDAKSLADILSRFSNYKQATSELFSWTATAGTSACFSELSGVFGFL